MSELEPIDSRGRWLVWLNRLGPVLALLAVFAFFAVIAPPSFRGAHSLQNIPRHATVVGTAALGMTLVIISGGIDLSVGSVIALSTVVVAQCLKWEGCPPLLFPSEFQRSFPAAPRLPAPHGKMDARKCSRFQDRLC